MKRLWIYGAGGLGLEILDLALCCGYEQERLGFLDDSRDADSKVEGTVVSPGLDHENCLFQSGDEVVVGVGSPAIRAKLWERLTARKITAPVLVAPTAVVSPSATIEPGCLIFHYCFISALVNLSGNNLVNVRASLAHHAQVGLHSVVGPGATMLGQTSVGARSELGGGSYIYPEQSAGDEVTIGMGACVFKDVESGATAAGNPARIFSKSS